MKRSSASSSRRSTLPRERARAFTLVETIVALSIVATLGLAAVEFSIASTKAASSRQAPTERQGRARSLFLRLEDAILCFETVQNDDPKRIEANADSVSLRTRTVRTGACLQRYEFDPARRAVVVTETPFSNHAGKVEMGAARESIVATDVSDFRVDWEPRSRRLEVSMRFAGRQEDATMRRRWVIP